MKMVKKKLSASLFRGMQIWNKENKMSRFINTELESESESDLESKSDTELMAKVQSSSDSE